MEDLVTDNTYVEVSIDQGDYCVKVFKTHSDCLAIAHGRAPSYEEAIEIAKGKVKLLSSKQSGES